MPLRLATYEDVARQSQSSDPPVLELACAGLDTHGHRLLDRVDLTIRPGETVLIAGPDRAVRDAVMRCAAGLEPDLRGRVRLTSGVGAVLPDPALPRGDTPLETVMLCAPVDPVVAFSALEEVGLQEVADMPLKAMSEGKLRLLWLACACAGRPGLLVLNGVFDGLSLPEVECLFSAFAAVRAARGLGVVMSGDDRRMLLPMCNRVVELTRQPGIVLSQEVNRPAPVEVQALRQVE